MHEKKKNITSYYWLISATAMGISLGIFWGYNGGLADMNSELATRDGLSLWDLQKIKREGLDGWGARPGRLLLNFKFQKPFYHFEIDIYICTHK